MRDAAPPTPVASPRCPSATSGPWTARARTTCRGGCRWRRTRAVDGRQALPARPRTRRASRRPTPLGLDDPLDGRCRRPEGVRCAEAAQRARGGAASAAPSAARAASIAPSTADLPLARATALLPSRSQVRRAPYEKTRPARAAIAAPTPPPPTPPPPRATRAPPLPRRRVPRRHPCASAAVWARRLSYHRDAVGDNVDGCRFVATGPAGRRQAAAAADVGLPSPSTCRRRSPAISWRARAAFELRAGDRGRPAAPARAMARARLEASRRARRRPRRRRGHVRAGGRSRARVQQVKVQHATIDTTTAIATSRAGYRARAVAAVAKAAPSRWRPPRRASATPAPTRAPLPHAEPSGGGGDLHSATALRRTAASAPDVGGASRRQAAAARVLAPSNCKSWRHAPRGTSRTGAQQRTRPPPRSAPARSRGGAAWARPTMRRRRGVSGTLASATPASGCLSSREARCAARSRHERPQRDQRREHVARRGLHRAAARDGLGPALASRPHARGAARRWRQVRAARRAGCCLITARTSKRRVWRRARQSPSARSPSSFGR